MNQPVFITGSPAKAENLVRHLGLPLDHERLELDEIQASLEGVVEHKARQAYAKLGGRAILVNDMSIEFTALGGLPGPFVKFFMEPDGGLENMCRMLDGFTDRTATSRNMYGYYDGRQLEFFEGRLYGEITKSPRPGPGLKGGAIFCPEGYGGRTMSQLSENEYSEVARSLEPHEALRKFLESKATY